MQVALGTRLTICHTRDSFRKISKGGKSTSEDILGGGGGARVQWAVFNFEGLQFPRRGTKFSRGGGGDAAPPLNETLHTDVKALLPSSPVEVGDGEALGVFLGVAPQEIGDVLPGGGANETTGRDAHHGSVAGAVPAATQR